MSNVSDQGTRHQVTSWKIAKEILHPHWWKHSLEYTYLSGRPIVWLLHLIGLQGLEHPKLMQIVGSLFALSSQMPRTGRRDSLSLCPMPPEMGRMDALQWIEHSSRKAWMSGRGVS